MDARKVPVFCYWNGCIKDGPDGPFYQGSSPRVLRVESKIELPKLLDDLHRVTGFEKGKFQFDLIGRYPSIVQQSTVKYVRLPVVDDCSLETMLEVLSFHPSINNVELYLEVKPVSNEGISLVAHHPPLPNNGTSSANCSRQEVANVVADDASVRDDTLSTPREDNNKNWTKDEESTDAENWIKNGGDNGTAETDSNMETPSPTEGLSDSASKQLIFSSSWLDESELHVGMLYKDIDELKNAVKLYSNRRQRVYIVYDYTFEFKCTRYNCGWVLKTAKTKNNSYEITAYTGPHTCTPEDVDSDFLAGELEGLIRAQPSLSIAELIKWVKEEFGYTVSSDNICAAKTKAVTAILGDLDKSFSILPKFMAALCSSNKMLMDLQYDIFPNRKGASFRSVFWMFRQSIEGFPHLRPLIMVDTIDLSGKYPMKMLVAAGSDAENQLFPLAFAIVTHGSLSADSWRWFFACIRKKVTQREDICLITSPNPNIVAVVNEPECQWACHRFCLKHLCFKFYEVFQNNLMTELVYQAGSSRDISSFDYYLKKIEKMNPQARKWLDKMPPHQWALAHDDGGMRFGIMDTNTIFATYGFLNKSRDLPIITYILLIFDHLAEVFISRRALPEESLNSGDKYAKHVMKKLEEYKVASGTHDVLPLDKTGEMFQVTEVMQKKRFFVHLSDRVCTCGILQLYKYPCSHVLAVCKRLNIDHLQYVNNSYNTESSLGVYAAEFHPLARVADWPEDTITPRLFPPGRYY